MSVSELVTKLKSKNINLLLEEDNIGVDAPKGSLTPDLILEIKANKNQILEYLRTTIQASADSITKVGNDETYFPVTPIQENIYYLQALNKEDITYNIPVCIPVEERLDTERLENVFQELVNRHESLRTAFEIVENQLKQRVFSDISVPFEAISSNDSLPGLYEAFVRPFELSKAPLIRVQYVLRETGEDFLFVDIHHIVSDGFSQNILINEFSQLYGGVQLSAPEFQFKDYAVWLNSDHQLAKLKTQKEFWCDQFKNNIPVLELPYDHPRPAVKSFRGSTYEFNLSLNNEKLNQLLKDENLSLLMLLYGAWSILLARLSNQDDIICGVTSSGRNNAEVMNIVGMFVNILPLRSFPNEDKTCREFLNEIKMLIINSFDNQEFPHSSIIDELNVERDLSRNPLFDVLFNYTHGSDANNSTDNKVEWNRSKFDLALSAMVNGTNLDFSLEYSTDLFHKQTIVEIAQFYLNCINQLLEKINQPIYEIDIISEKLHNKLVYQFNDTFKETPADENLVSLFEKSVSSAPNNIAVKVDGNEYTYAEVNSRANQLASLLKQNGTGPGDYVGIMVDRSVDMVTGTLGILKTGAAYVPFEVNVPKLRLANILKDLHISTIITNYCTLPALYELQWQLDKLQNIVLTDVGTEEIPVESFERNAVSELWDHIIDLSDNDVTAGGFYSIYTGEAFKSDEVSAYVNHIEQLLSNNLSPNSKVLEIGCGSGLITRHLAPKVSAYTGIDPSEKSLAYNRALASAHNVGNISLMQGFADEIDSLCKEKYDVIILASAVQFFPGVQYLNDVLKKCCRLLNSGGLILVADVLDPRRKEAFRKSIEQFREDNAGQYTFKSKIDLSNELYVDENIFFDFPHKGFPGYSAKKIERQGKFGNELDYRYDLILTDQPAEEGDGNQEKPRINFFTQFDIAQQSGENIGVGIPSNSPAYVIYTSGSTGEPKGVLVSHNPVVNTLLWVNSSFNVSADDTLLFVTSLCFDLSVYDIFGSLAAGAAIYIAKQDDIKEPARLVEILNNGGITFWDSAPAFLQQLSYVFSDTNLTNNQLRLVFLSGDWIPLSLPDKIRTYCKNAEVISLGGATEAAIWSNFFPVKEIDPEWKSIPYGKPIQNAKYYILNKHLKPCPMGVPGDLYIGGECLAAGYVNDEALTAQKFIPNPFELNSTIYKTGDVAKWHTDGNIEFLGRVDGQVKIRGYRIELGEIKKVLSSYDKISESVVLVKENNNNEKYIVAYYVAEKELNKQDLVDHLSTKLPEYMTPAFFVYVESIPVTKNGKINIDALPDEQEDLVAEIVKPESDTEKILAAIWAEILGIDAGKVDINTSFFNLGGHSLHSAVLQSKIVKHFNKEIAISDLFRSPTVRQISKLVDNKEESQLKPIKKAAEAEYYPISIQQRRLHFLYEMDKETTVYNIPQVFKLNGELDFERLQNAINELTGRHEILRTCFRVFNGEPFQFVSEKAEVKIHILQCSDDAEIEKTIAGFIQPFNLSDASPIRIAAIKQDDRNFILVIDMHHIITDAFSNTLLFREVLDLYNGKGVSEKTIDYKDYACWQQTDEYGAKLEKQKSFWIKKYDDELPRLGLPTDFVRPKFNDFKGDALGFSFSKEQFEQIRNLAKENQTTVFTALFSIFNIFLSKLCNQEDIIVGTPVLGRQDDTFDMLGFFVNTIVLREQVNGDESFSSFLERFNRNVIESLDNQLYPYEDLVEVLKIERDTARNPIFDVSFSYESVDEDAEYTTPGIAIEVMANKTNTSKFDLSLFCRDTGNGIDLVFEYSTALFKKSSIEKFKAVYMQIATELLNNETKKIKDIYSLPQPEQEEILQVFNEPLQHETEGFWLLDAFEQQAVQNPHSVALLFQGQEMTYGQLDAKADELKNKILQEGFRKGDVVGIVAERSFEMIIGIFAALKAGGVFLPIDPQYPTDRIEYVVKDSNAQLILCQNKFVSLVPDQTEYLDMDDHCNYVKEGDRGSIKNDVAYIIYTSGSTGIPKGVVIEQKAVGNTINYLNDEFPVQLDDIYLFKTSYVFDVSISEIFTWFINGGKLAILAPEKEKQADEIVEAIEEYKVTHINFVPSFFNVFVGILNAGNVDKLKSLRHLFLAGEAVNSAVLKDFIALGADTDIENLYGPTESSIYASRFSLTNWLEDYVPIGKPIANTHLYIVDKYNKLVGVGVEGELCIAGVGLAREYNNNEPLTSEKFIPNPFVAGEKMYKTGDLVRWQKDGNIQFLGRNDDQVKIRGFRIEIGEIEQRILEFPEITNVIVMVIGQDEIKKKLVGFIVSEKKVGSFKLKKFLKDKLPDYMIPSRLVQIDEIPFNASGKANRKLLKEIYQNNNNDDAKEFLPPKSETEIAIAKIWCDFLEISSVSLNDNFFDIGGHSLLLTKVVYEIENTFNCKIEYKDFFSMSLGQICAYVESAEK